MIQISEIKIVNPKINGNRELVFTVRAKKEDYTIEIFEQMCTLADDGIPMAIVMQEFQGEAIENNLSSKRSRLAFIMGLYAKKIGSDEKETVQKIYSKYNIKSRSELTEQQLDEEIKTFTLGLEWD